MPSLPHRPALAPRDGISSFVSVQSSDSYYSDEEIAILHDVVAAAQENLELLPEGERLATNALFQAYDAVLPLYGVDPEEDHHISRLVFRIGGERGDGSLLEKLRAVLSRMGIGLEFDSRSDGSRVLSDRDDGPEYHDDPSNRGSSQPSPALTATDENSGASLDDLSGEHHPVFQPVQRQEFASLPRSQPSETYHLDDSTSPPRLTHGGAGTNHSNVEPARQIKPPQNYTPSTAGDTEQTHPSHQSLAGTNEQRGASDTTVQPVEALNARPVKNGNETPALSVKSKPVRTVNWLLPPDSPTEPVQDGGEIAQSEAGPMAKEPVGHTLDVQQSPEPDVAIQEPVTQQPVTQQPVEPPAEQDQPAKNHSDKHGEYRVEVQVVDPQPEEDLGAEARYALLERRAGKAAGYLLLLRGISHWKQHALDRLERTAVARRHILRMRHFDSWELVTAETRFRGRRVFAARLMALWLTRADEDSVMEHYASAHAQRKLAQNLLTKWFASCLTDNRPQHPPRSLNSYLQHWQSACASVQKLHTHSDTLHHRHEQSQAIKTWHRQVAMHHKNVSSFRRFNVVRDSLSQWHLETRVEIFRARMGVRLIRNSLSRWQSACRTPPSLGRANGCGDGSSVNHHHQTSRKLPRSLRGGSYFGNISDRMLKTKVLENWQQQTIAVAKISTTSRHFAVHQCAQKALESWHVDVARNRSLHMWAKRGCFYVSVTHALKTWRSKASWRSNTRKSYARCRQHVKATFTKGYLSRWKIATRAHGNISWETHQHHDAMNRDRLARMLCAWRDKSSNDWGAGRLLTAAWVGEWQRMSEDHAGMQTRAEQAWGVTLESRYWSQWQSTLLQLKSREYVALDVRERNRKKVARRLLLHWKGDRDFSMSQQSMATRANFASSRRGAGFGLSHSAVPLSRAVHERSGGLSLRASRIQEVGPTAEEEDHDGAGSATDVDGVVMDTPTRWTGMASSVRLPSMTPFAPLPTPFERELRERYNKSVPTVPTGQLSRLSFAQAQRLSVAETRRAGNESRPEASSRGE
ncbi:Sfi1 spindle body protein-domain-containing protein [Colletotrichum navitas]|uniref:Sfi1 spindle body protein-domain-containing protein n=1 Tax=Colletotrichum navitas TaxID=681940 RepID=A0AAD8PJN1_9PEZI|nr:Sfi1 spindle body protein-domain-containing protein [Colletotrichum navitas]KAK1565981.1 Sfi1 spindle body protein-domain-containing protein [Colletotrichum navitas]